MFEISEDGGNPPVVVPGSITQNKEQKFLCPRKWSISEVLKKFSTVFKLDVSNFELVEFNHASSTFRAVSLEHSDGGDLVLTCERDYQLDINGMRYQLGMDCLGNVLANYEFGGFDAVAAYLEATDD